MENKLPKIILLSLIPIICLAIFFTVKPNLGSADTTGNLGAIGSFPTVTTTSRQICATSTLPVNGTFTSISYVADSAISNVMGVALYADNGASRPGSLLASNAPTADTIPTSKSWATSTINYVGTANTIYWMCMWGGPASNPNFYYVTTTGYNYVVGDTNATWETWRATFVTNSFTTGRRVGIYATYTPAGGGDTTVVPAPSISIQGGLQIQGGLIIPK